MRTRMLFMALLALCMPICGLCQELISEATDLEWAIASVDETKNTVEIFYYGTCDEVLDNGKCYGRIYGRNPSSIPYYRTETSYGVRREGKYMFVCDYETKTEKLAFDFTLSVGDKFTTYNGMEWVIDETRDTLIREPLPGDRRGIEYTRRLLEVHTTDGLIQDTWLEGFGSFKNHLMITSVAPTDIKHTLWQSESYYNHIAREISCDPIYTHDTGWLGGTFDEDDDRKDTTCVYNNGILTIETTVCRWPARYYYCFFRKGNDIYLPWGLELTPHIDSGEKMYYTDKFSFVGLPDTDEGYKIHWGNREVTGIKEVTAMGKEKRMDGRFYDLQGRELPREPQKGLYIKGGKVVMGKE